MAELPRPFDAPPPVVEELRALLERARRGDLEVLPQLREMLDANPQVYQFYGDLGRHAEHSWIGLAAGPDLGLQEALARKVAALKSELAGGGDAPPLERLLIDRIAATWLQLNYADATAAQARDPTVKQAEFAQKRQDRSHRRFLSAIAALATVKRRLSADRNGSIAMMGPPDALTPPPAAAGPGDRLAGPPHPAGGVAGSGRLDVLVDLIPLAVFPRAGAGLGPEDDRGEHPTSAPGPAARSATA